MTRLGTDECMAFPGEGWFFYWKTSASLWKSKIQACGVSKIIIPINWAFHTETGESVDFGAKRPDSDLRRLWEICQEIGVEVCFLMPVTPVPFLVNGGVPHLLARNYSADENMISRVVIDGSGNIVKFYSFFDHRIYEGFARFVETLGQYFSESGISAPIWGLNAGYIDDKSFCSYLKDTSKTFDTAFSRFLSAKKNEGVEVSSSEEETELKGVFYNQIKDLYLEAASEALRGNWEGCIKVSFLGGNSSDFNKRSWGQSSLASNFSSSLSAISCGAIPSSALLEKEVKAELLENFLKENVLSVVKQRLFPSSLDEEGIGFKMLRFFRIFHGDSLAWHSLGLWDYLEHSYQWVYELFENESEASDPGGIMLFHGRDIDQKLFNRIVKSFLSGGSIVIDQNGLTEELRQKVMLFILENNLKTEKVNKFTNITNITLGDGRITLFDGDKLQSLSSDKLETFWQVLFSTFDVRHLMKEEVEGIEFSWKTRETVGAELNYEEVRRLSLYNRTSYKKRQRIKLVKNSVLMKVVDDHNVTVKSTSHDLDINLLPSGHVSLDFGFYS